ncbi:hypothetical protein EDC04DRAFT_2697450 [Pisolithus marmoratus]|nr:hypothetical protein EDC04DRAFT_2697450 [Pisolithus marmoratus]
MWKRPSTLATLLLLFNDRIGQHFLVTHTTFPFSHCYTSSTLTSQTRLQYLLHWLTSLYACAFHGQSKLVLIGQCRPPYLSVP